MLAVVLWFCRSLRATLRPCKELLSPHRILAGLLSETSAFKAGRSSTGWGDGRRPVERVPACIPRKTAIPAQQPSSGPDRTRLTILLGRTETVHTKTGSTTKISAGSITLFGKDRRVTWQVPRKTKTFHGHLAPAPDECLTPGISFTASECEKSTLWRRKMPFSGDRLWRWIFLLNCCRC